MAKDRLTKEKEKESTTNINITNHIVVKKISIHKKNSMSITNPALAAASTNPSNLVNKGYTPIRKIPLYSQLNTSLELNNLSKNINYEISTNRNHDRGNTSVNPVNSHIGNKESFRNILPGLKNDKEQIKIRNRDVSININELFLLDIT